jgi:aspartate/methionine/tyrosine aminotransferase
VDEIFANQVFASSLTTPPTDITPFTSILSLAPTAAPEHTYILAGPTKDFGASGIKVGALVAQHNPDILELVETSLNEIPISSAADAIFTTILDDEAFCSWFLEENRLRLARAYELFTGWCDFQGLPYVNASSDLRSHPACRLRLTF